MKRYVIIIVLFILAACRPDISGDIARQPEIFPDYKEVTIPCNIAPMNFQVISRELIRLRAEKESYDALVSAEAKNSAPTFGLR